MKKESLIEREDFSPIPLVSSVTLNRWFNFFHFLTFKTIMTNLNIKRNIENN